MLRSRLEDVPEAHYPTKRGLEFLFSDGPIPFVRRRRRRPSGIEDALSRALTARPLLWGGKQMQTWRSAVPLVAARTTSGRVNWFVLGLIAFALAPLVGCGSPGEPPSGGSRTPPSVVFFTAAPATVQPGSASTLAWSVTGADTLSIDHGVGTVIGRPDSR
jgi:hypothetical protein